MNISIFASIGCQNLWDELILKNEIKEIEKIYKNKKINFRVFTYEKKDTFFQKENIKYLEYFPIEIKKIKNIKKNIYNFFSFFQTVLWSDLIIIWWWWVIFDNEIKWVKNPLRLWSIRRKVFNLFSKRVMFYWIWIDIKNKNNLWLLKNIFKNSFKIYVRDTYSKNLLKQINIKSKLILDPVFYDNINNKKQINNNYLIKSIDSKTFKIDLIKTIDFKWKRVWLALRKGFMWKWEKKKIKDLINFLLKKQANIILMPHSFHKTNINSNDYLFLKQFIKKDIKITTNLKETYQIYKNKYIDICFSQRLHSIILSQVYKIDFIWLSYSKKTKEILKKL